MEQKSSISLQVTITTITPNRRKKSYTYTKPTPKKAPNWSLDFDRNSVPGLSKLGSWLHEAVLDVAVSCWVSKVSEAHTEENQGASTYIYEIYSAKPLWKKISSTKEKTPKTRLLTPPSTNPTPTTNTIKIPHTKPNINTKGSKFEVTPTPGIHRIEVR